ncbi:MAG TPA: GNAT family N-acetyltransferase [Anaerolineales bacterium]|nr:GNAT family N-acetyltransferase [Anaerolineales bacterium]
MNLSTVPASNYPLADLAQFVNRGFEAYFVPIEFNPVTFLNMVHKDGIDLTASHVLLVDGQPCGIALIARRGDLRASRLAAMGIAEEARGKGAGSWLMDVLVHEARQRSDREMVLEVIEQNEPAVKLYRKSGFQAVRRLIGFERKEAEERAGSALYKIDLREMGRLVSEHGIPDLPWQLSGETIAQLNPPACAYCKGSAYVAISNVEAEHVVIWSLLVEPQARGQGLGTDLLKSLVAQHTDRTWHVPAILPEELGKVFERAGFEREELSQWQMRLGL